MSVEEDLRNQSFKDLPDNLLNTYGTEKASSNVTMNQINKTKNRTPPSFEGYDAGTLGVDRPIHLADLNNSKQERLASRFESPPPTYGN